MTERLSEMQRMVAESRQRLDELARRVSDLRRQIAQQPAGAAEAGPHDAAGRLFEGEGASGKDAALDDIELNFVVLDYEDPERDGR